MRLRGLFVAAVACATFTGAMASPFSSMYHINNLTLDVHNTFLFETDGGAFNNVTSLGTVHAGDSFIGSNAVPSPSIFSFMVGMVSSTEVVLFMRSDLALGFNGLDFDTIFAPYTEGLIAAALSTSTVPILDGFVQGLRNFSYTDNTSVVHNNVDLWFNTTTSSNGSFTAIKFTSGVFAGDGSAALTPEPMTLALIGLAPLAYMKRRKAKRA